MEYSVYDLVRILVRKWYIVLLTMCLLGGVSVFTARQSYAQAVADYEAYTTETVPLEGKSGTLTGVYQCRYAVSDLSKYQTQEENKRAFVDAYVQAVSSGDYDVSGKPSVYAAAETAYTKLSADFSSLLMDSRLFEKVSATAGEAGLVEPPTLAEDGSVSLNGGPLAASAHLAVTQLDESTLRLTISDLDEDSARTLLDLYLRELTAIGSSDYSMRVTTNVTSLEYFSDPIQLTDNAQLAQIVMQRPTQAPIILKTVGTAAAFAFVFVCFGILLAAFIKDSRTQEHKKSAAAQNSRNGA